MWRQAGSHPSSQKDTIALEENLLWVNNLSETEYVDDALILAGDVSDSMITLELTLQTLVHKFADVFFVPGNHDLWTGDDMDSLGKLLEIFTLCKRLGIHTVAKRIGTPEQGCWVCPILSWHHQSWDPEPDLEGWDLPTDPALCMADFSRCRFPPAVSMFDDSASRRELLLEKRFLMIPCLAKASGSNFLRARVEQLKPDVHIFGHTHFGWDTVLDGVRYVQAALGYPHEREMRWLSMANGDFGAAPLLLWSSSSGFSKRSRCRWSAYYEHYGRKPEKVLELASYAARGVKKTKPEASPEDREGKGKKIVDALCQMELREADQGRGSNYELWKAAKDGHFGELERLIKAGKADVNFEVQPDDLEEEPLPIVVSTKTSPSLTAQALHAAAMCHKDEAYDCVKALIVYKAKVQDKARIVDRDGSTRELEAIHLAAGAGNSEILKLLVKNEADPNAEALQWSDPKPQAAANNLLSWLSFRLLGGPPSGAIQPAARVRPREAAAFKESVEALLEERANIFAKNNEGNTALHLAAKLGHADLVKYLLHDRHTSNAKPPMPMTEKLCGEQKAEEKLQLVKESAMKESLQLVKRRSARRVGREACRLSCAYIEPHKWTWSGGPDIPWQVKLAPQDPKRSREVKVKILILPGVINSCLVHSLAITKDQKIFTKLVVHALLKHLWESFRPLFLVDLGHQFLSTAVLSYWILLATQVETPRMISCALWGILAAEGILEIAMFIWTCVTCHSKLGRRLCIRWMKRAYYRFIMGACALALAIETSQDYEPVANSSILLSINSLLHWITMLFEIRAFRATGRRILPIMKSVLPIVGMLVIMLFISLAFMHAFWAMDRSGISEISMFNIVVLLFTGEQFLSPEDLMEIHMTAMILLSIGGVFIFLTCTINVFIAVLSDCYDQEQERMVCTFLKERARICSGYFLRPKFRASGFGFIQKGITKLSWWRWVILVVAIIGLYALLLYLITEIKLLTRWLSAIYPAAAVFGVQCILHDVATVDWKSNYLWFCHQVDVEEDSSVLLLVDCSVGLSETNGRITRMKKYIRQTIKDCDLRIKALSSTMDAWQTSNKENLAVQMNAVSEALSKVDAKVDKLIDERKDYARCDTPVSKLAGKAAGQREKTEEEVLTAARGGGSKEPVQDRHVKHKTDVASGWRPADQDPADTLRPPPTDTMPHEEPSKSPKEPSPPRGRPPRDSLFDVGVGDIDALKEEVGSIKGSLKESSCWVKEQGETQEELRTHCEDGNGAEGSSEPTAGDPTGASKNLQGRAPAHLPCERYRLGPDLLAQVVRIAETRQSRKSKKRHEGEPEPPGGAEVNGRGNEPCFSLG
eukprot:g24715.t1